MASLILVLVLLFVHKSVSFAQSVSVLHSFKGDDASEFPSATLTQGRDSKLYGTTAGLTFGSVFRLTTQGSGGELIAFDISDGADVIAGLLLASDGNFYGTATFGGTLGKGTFFRVTPGGDLTVLHEFAGDADGAFPEAAPIEASDGNLYGTTRGASEPSTIYQYARSGKFSTIYQFDDAHGIAAFVPLVQGADGNLYGTAQAGGANNCGTIFKITRSGTPLQLYSFLCGSGGKTPSAPLFQASDGNLYGTTESGGSGGTGGLGIVFRFTKKGVFSVVHNFTGNPDGSNPTAGVIEGTDGKLYGAASTGGSKGFGTLFQIALDGTYTRLYTFDAGTGKDPSRALLQHTNGLFYGTAVEGGAFDFGTIFSLDMKLGPFITFVRPTGKVGQTAQILGTGLTGSTSVTFNGVKADTFKVVSDTYMTATVPSGATTGKVVVTTPAGSLTSNVDFRISK